MTAPEISARIALLYEQHGDQLRRFVCGILHDAQLASDVLQATFVKMIESGGPDRQEAEKAWLFRVAYHQALAIRRRQAIGDKANRLLARALPTGSDSAEVALLRHEQLQRVRSAVRQLPAEQQQMVQLRIYEAKTFAEIAAELDIPLGTALSRMRAALKRLREALHEEF